MKKVLYVVIGLFVLYIILAFAGPKEIKVEREIAINKPAATVKSKLGDFKFFHDKWSPWTERDPDMKCTYEGTPGEVGHQYTWSGNKEVGKGEMSIAGYNGDTLIQRLSFDGEPDAKSYFIMKDNSASTDVTWGMRFDVGFFARPVMLFMDMDKMMGADYEKGLSTLKKELENTKDEVAVTKYTITEQEWPDVTYIGKREKVFFQNITPFLGKNFPALWSDLQKKNVSPQSMPTAIFMDYNEEKGEADLVAAAKVNEDPKIKGWDKFTFNKGKVLHVAYYGPYEKSAVAHKQIGDYMRAKDLKQSTVIEEYVTDPGAEPDTAKWLTNIYYFTK